MEIHFYAEGANGSGQRCLEAIGKAMPDGSLHMHYSVRNLMMGLSKQHRGDAALILLCGSLQSLNGLLAFRDCLIEHWTILILPDIDGKTIAKGHRLCPRYLTYIESDFDDVTLVLEKHLKRLCAGGSLDTNASDTAPNEGEL